MPKFSEKSLKKLNTCDPKLIKLFNEVIKITDITIICGARDAIEQNKAFLQGKSKVNWPKSKHNSIPSKAVDVALYPIHWDKIGEFYFLCGVVKTIAFQMNIGIEWGGNFKTIQDYCHFELIHTLN